MGKKVKRARQLRQREGTNITGGWGSPPAAPAALLSTLRSATWLREQQFSVSPGARLWGL